ATIIHRPWLGYAAQKNWALDNLPIRSNWVFFLDADEAITPELKSEILGITTRPADQTPTAGFYVNRLTFFLGRPIRHCRYRAPPPTHPPPPVNARRPHHGAARGPRPVNRRRPHPPPQPHHAPRGPARPRALHRQAHPLPQPRGPRARQRARAPDLARPRR